MLDDGAFEIPDWITQAIELDPVAAAMVIGSFVRDAIEDFHVAHLTDDQMAELNPLIRQGICDALTLLNVAADGFDADHHAALLAIALKPPADYWEEPNPHVAQNDLAGAKAYLRRPAARMDLPDN